MKKTLLICNSNMFIPYVLTELLEHKDKEYIIISDIGNIIDFINELNIGNIITFKYEIGRVFTFFIEKHRIKAFLSNYIIEKVVFYHAEFGGFANWLLLKFAKSNVRIEYCKIFESIPMPEVKWYNGWRLKIREFIYYNYFPIILDDGIRYFPSLPCSFFRKIKAINIKTNINYHLINDLLKCYIQKLNIDCKILLLSGFVVYDNIVTKNEYINKINNIIDVIGKENLCLKLHPRYNDLHGVEQELKQIPQNIPGSILIDSFDIYIGHSSTMLVEVAQRGKIAISFLYIMEMNSKDNQEQLYNFLQNRLDGKGEILYPRNIDEFEQIIKVSTPIRTKN